MDLGIAYAGSQKEELKVQLSQIMRDPKTSMAILAFTELTLGLVYVGSCCEAVAQSIIYALMDQSAAELSDPLLCLLLLALGLLSLGKQGRIEVVADVSKTFDEKIRKSCNVTLMSLAHARTGNVLKVQKLLGYHAKHLDTGETHQGPVVLGITLVAMAKELGPEMMIYSLEHPLQYREQSIHRAVPLALGLLYISNPKVNVLETLCSFSHALDNDISMAANIALGLVGTGAILQSTILGEVPVVPAEPPD